MSGHSAEQVRAPDWYINHFMPLGHTRERLQQAWRDLPSEARESYRAILGTRDLSPEKGEA